MTSHLAGLGRPLACQPGKVVIARGKKKSPEADTRALLEYIVPRLEVLETTFFRR
jgi:hypothetical protein